MMDTIRKSRGIGEKNQPHQSSSAEWRADALHKKKNLNP